MYCVLLSGGSGKRLWPLSNDLRSKQYIKLLGHEDNEQQQCSMVQRVWRQLENAGLRERSAICASSGQVEILHNQLGDVRIAVEPDRRDTFPAVVLSCAYLVSRLRASPDDVVCVLPVDPYTDHTYFESLKKLEALLLETDADIALMGVTPTAPSSKFGYIVPRERKSGYITIDRFREKPSAEDAQALIAQGALWNCGVFCFRMKRVLDRLSEYGVTADYDDVYAHYDALPKKSFDYEVLEKAVNMVALPFSGLWKDLGTWSVLSSEMHSPGIGNVAMEGCEKSSVINELDIPVITLGTDNLMVVASWDGILVADKNAGDNIKNVANRMALKPMYEERRWGTLKTVDISQSSEGFTLTRKLLMFDGMSSSYHYHQERDEAVTVLRGMGELIVEGVRMTVSQGTTITIPRGKRHAYKANSNMEFMEIHIGKTIGDEDIHRITFDWDDIMSIK